MSTMTLVLDPKLDLHALDRLRDQILSCTDQDLSLNAEEVARFGALAVQLIRAAAQSWAKSGHSLSLANVSPECCEQLELLGFTPETITAWKDVA